MDHTIRLNGIKYTSSRFLAPRITVYRDGGKQVYDAGLPFTAMRPAVCDDHSWYCTPLRNLLFPRTAEVRFQPRADGQIAVEAELDFKEKLNSVEILQNTYTMAFFDPRDEFGTASGTRRLFLLTLTDVTGKPAELTVDVDADSAVAFTVPVDPREQALGGIFPVRTKVGANFTKLYFVVDKTDLASAVLSVTGKNFSWRMPLRDLKSGDAVSCANAKGLTAVLQNEPRAFRCALPMASGKVSWKKRLPVTLPEGVMVLRAVSRDGKVWYSHGCPLSETDAKDDKLLTLAGLNEYRKWQRFQLPAHRVPVIDYEFSPANGVTLRTKAGREYYAQLGGHAQLASDQNGNRAENKPGLSTILAANLKKPGARPMPEWKNENGRSYLHFDGRSGSFIMLPRTALPQYSGFHMTMEIRPRKFTQRQVIWCQYNYYQTGFELHLTDGKLGSASVIRRPQDLHSPYWQRLTCESGLALDLNKWNKVELIYDGKVLTLGVNGRYEAFACDGIARWLSVSAFGGWKDEMFNGDLRSFSITPALPSK
jgi:hypothetical protein